MTDDELMLIYAVRYALGRRTYAVQMTTKYISERIPALSKGCKAAMIRDIKEQGRLGYGDDCDKGSWMVLLRELKASMPSGREERS